MILFFKCAQFQSHILAIDIWLKKWFAVASFDSSNMFFVVREKLSAGTDSKADTHLQYTTSKAGGGLTWKWIAF